MYVLTKLTIPCRNCGNGRLCRRMRQLRQILQTGHSKAELLLLRESVAICDIHESLCYLVFGISLKLRIGT